MNSHESPESNLEHLSTLRARIVELAAEVDKESIANLSLDDFVDDDVSIIENYFAHIDGTGDLTKEAINQYIAARDTLTKDNPGHSNRRIKDVIANFIINKTPDIWLGL